ncbi:plasmid segregation protein ParM domain-containing protein [Vibrio harveyi]|uniref:plasmid segregation protein ParM domain-containing protein n=1 Tax=Vibrio harveyi TaxID=669 RepID=UPI00390BE8AA
MTNSTQLNQPTLVSIDDGSSAIKVAYYDKNNKLQTFSFDSRVVEGHIVTGDEDTVNYTVDGKPYHVTKGSAHTIPTNTEDYQVSVASRILVHHALRKCGVVGSVNIVVTIPPAQFFTSTMGKNVERVSRKEENLLGAIKYLGSDPVVQINEIHVLPESFAAFHRIARTNGLDVASSLCVDIGGFTTDIMRYDDDFNIVEAKSHAIGALDMLNAFKAEAEAKFDFAGGIPDSKVVTAFTTGKLGRKDPSQVAEIALKHRVEFQQKILGVLPSSNDLSLIDNVVFTGGAIHYLEKEFLAENEVVVSDNSQFDGVIGGLVMIQKKIANAAKAGAK